MRPISGAAIEDQSNGALFRMAVWAESRGESALGKLAVACVIQNRAEKSGKSIKQIVLAPLQFSSFNRAGMPGITEDDPNRAKLLTAYETDRAGWAACDAVCELVEENAVIDPTNNALNYYVAKMPNPPKWGLGHPAWKDHGVIGAHRFGVAG